MEKWLNPVYKRLAASELGAGHTAGIVPTKEVEAYFGNPLKKESHKIKTIAIEFWFGNKSKIIKTNVNYFLSDTHDHVHLTGNLAPAYSAFGAEVGDIVVFWKSVDDDTNFKAELIKQNSERWHQIKSKEKFPSAGGLLLLNPPGVEFADNLNEENEIEYQVPLDIEPEWSAEDFPPELKKEKVIAKEKYRPKRSKTKGNYVLRLKEYKCEIDPAHETFLTPNSFPYMEKHHLIPLEFYDEFEYDLDDINNITILCPVCHRRVHHGSKGDISKLLEILWSKHKDGLLSSHLSIELDQLKNRYSI